MEISLRWAAFLALGSIACAAESGDTRDPAAIVLDVSDFHVFETTDAIASVQDMAVLEDGSVWVLNSVEPLFVGFSAEGGLLDTRGRRGGGPGEFRAVAGFVVGGIEGEAWALDNGRHALVPIARPASDDAHTSLPVGIPPGSVLPGMSLLRNTIRTARLGDEVVLPKRIGSGELRAITYWTTMFGADLVAWNLQTDSVRTIVSLPDVLGDMTERFEAARDFAPMPFWTRLWAICGEELRLYDFVRDELRGFTAEGVEGEPIPVPVPFTEVTRRQFARTLFVFGAVEAAGAVTDGATEMSASDSSRILDAISSRANGSPRELASVLPKYVDFRCADDGTMWLRPLDLESGSLDGGATWVRISPEGWTQEVRFPDGFDPYRFTARRVWGVLRDELDVASVAWAEAPLGN